MSGIICHLDLTETQSIVSYPEHKNINISTCCVAMMLVAREFGSRCVWSKCGIRVFVMVFVCGPDMPSVCIKENFGKWKGIFTITNEFFTTHNTTFKRFENVFTELNVINFRVYAYRRNLYELKHIIEQFRNLNKLYMCSQQWLHGCMNWLAHNFGV